MLFNTGSTIIHSKSGLLTSVAYKLGKDAAPTYCLEVILISISISLRLPHFMVKQMSTILLNNGSHFHFLFWVGFNRNSWSSCKMVT